MKKKSLMLLCVLTGCLGCKEEEDMILNREEAPLLILFESQETEDEGEISVRAFFYELDKSGILDHEVGIDSIPVPNLSIQVFVHESTLIGEYQTDGNGEVLLEASLSDLDGASMLEWTGTYNGTPFRKLQNL